MVSEKKEVKFWRIIEETKDTVKVIPFYSVMDLFMCYANYDTDNKTIEVSE